MCVDKNHLCVREADDERRAKGVVGSDKVYTRFYEGLHGL